MPQPKLLHLHKLQHFGHKVLVRINNFCISGRENALRSARNESFECTAPPQTPSQWGGDTLPTPTTSAQVRIYVGVMGTILPSPSKCEDKL